MTIVQDLFHKAEGLIEDLSQDPEVINDPNHQQLLDEEKEKVETLHALHNLTSKSPKPKGKKRVSPLQEVKRMGGYFLIGVVVGLELIANVSSASARMFDLSYNPNRMHYLLVDAESNTKFDLALAQPEDIVTGSQYGVFSSPRGEGEITKTRNGLHFYYVGDNGEGCFGRFARNNFQLKLHYDGTMRTYAQCSKAGKTEVFNTNWK